MIKRMGRMLSALKSRIFTPARYSIAKYMTGRMLGYRKASSYRELVEQYRGWVYALASKNATTVSNTPLRVYRNDTAIKSNHPLTLLMEFPNPRMTFEDILEHIELSLEIAGNAYVYKEHIGSQVFLHPLLPQYMKVHLSQEGVLKGYKYGRLPNDERFFSIEDIIHIRFSSLNRDIYYGVGPLEAAFLSACRLEAMAEYGHSFYQNQARPDFILRSSFSPDSEQKHRVIDQFKSDFRGQAGKPIMLPPDAEIQPIGYPPKDLIEVDVAKFTREEIAAIFGVPPAYMEIAKSRAELEAARAQYAQETILPRCKRLERGLTMGLASEYGAGNLSFRFDNPVPDDKDLAIKERKANVEAGITTPNEEREKLGLPAIDGGDELKGNGSPPPDEEEEVEDEEDTDEEDTDE